MRVPDPLEGWFEPWGNGRCNKPSCKCEQGDVVLCMTCQDAWAETLCDADVHEIEDTSSEDDPWLAEVRDPAVDDELWDRAAALEHYPDD